MVPTLTGAGTVIDRSVEATKEGIDRSRMIFFAFVRAMPDISESSSAVATVP